jgi:Ca-activated chloride channel family protein
MMSVRICRWVFSALLFSVAAAAQGPLHINEVGAFTPNALLSSGTMSMELWNGTNIGENRSPLQGQTGSVSMLDTKAPSRARREYTKGYELLMRQDFTAAIEHLNAAIVIYPKFVAAHNALGSAYLDAGKNDLAHEQFQQAVSLDDLLPNSYLNLGCAELALKNYKAAEDAIQKASSIAPLDLQVLTALTYAQFLNHDYAPAIATAKKVHAAKHSGASIVHYYAAAAWEGQNNIHEAQRELEMLLKEDPKSPAAEQARKILQELKAQPTDAAGKVLSTPQVALSITSKPSTLHVSAEDAAREQQSELQQANEEKQIAEAESMCTTCDPGAPEPGVSPAPATATARPRSSTSPWTLRSAVDEVAVFFSATDHGRSVTDLTNAEVVIRDNQKAPAVITGFRNEAELPLRLGLIIDTSESIQTRFKFEQHAATNFVQKVMTQKDDLAFVVGVATSVLLVQDFTGNQTEIAHGISALAPSGGTAVWDAVGFAADKLADRAEEKPAARILVVISDGFDNSSSASLKETIEKAERRGVIVYTVSTREISAPYEDLMGDHALKLLAERTGGAAFVPGALGFLNRSLSELQQLIRSRYLVSYKPAQFKSDGQFRAINITAQKSGHKLHVYARKGYYASAGPNAPVSY